jgi:hypothetical protein
MSDTTSGFEDLLASAATFQSLVPDAVLVGGSAAALHAHHRVSFDHDHVLTDLQARYDVILDALEREGQWVTNRVAHGKIILGQLGGIETGLRQLIRARPLETQEYALADGRRLVIPTLDETLRIKAFLVVKRNQTRDYLDVAALADTMGISVAGQVLANIDDYYQDREPEDATVAAQVAAQLADPRPKDSRTTSRLAGYKGLAARWHTWAQVVQTCQAVAVAMLGP